MRRRRALAAICAALLLAACQRSPETSGPTTIVDSAAEARKFVAAGDCAAAAPHLRAAVVTDPESLYLHYNLGVCASRLNARDETIREFQWVVAHADPKSPEAQMARRWLIDARVLTEDATAAATDDPTVGNSTVRGVVTWREGNQPPGPRSRQQLFLKGLRGTRTKELQYVRRSDEAGNYEFKNVAAGTYKLTDVIAGQPKWRLRVTIEPGKDQVIDLGPQNAAPGRDDFPQDG